MGRTGTSPRQAPAHRREQSGVRTQFLTIIHSGELGGKPEIWALGHAESVAIRVRRGRTCSTSQMSDRMQRGDRCRACGFSRTELRLEFMEGDRCYRGEAAIGTGLVDAQSDVQSCRRSVLGYRRFVYRGRRIPSLAGHYFYSDYCAGWLRSFRMQNGAGDRSTRLERSTTSGTSYRSEKILRERSISSPKIGIRLQVCGSFLRLTHTVLGARVVGDRQSSFGL